MKQSAFFQIKWIAVFCFFVLLGVFSRAYAYQVVIPTPYARMNLSKTHYLVAMTETDSSRGYTAVFNAKTRKLKYKLNLFFTDARVFLSDDGKRLIHVSEKIGDSEGMCFVTIYNKHGEIGRMTVFTRTSSDPEEEFYFSCLTDFEQEKHRLLIYTDDSIYRVDDRAMKIDVLPNNDNKNKRRFALFYDGFYTRDSLFDCSKLLVGKRDLKSQLCRDLNLRAVPDKNVAKYVLYLRITLNSNGTIYSLQVNATNVYDLEKKKWDFDNALMEQVIEALKSYSDFKQNIPKGIDHWKYSGTIYLSD